MVYAAIWRFRLCRVAIAYLLLVPMLSASAQGPSELAKLLQPLIDAHEGDVAVAVKHLPSGESFAAGADQVLPAASLIKLPVMVAAYHRAARGEVSLDELLTLRAEDKVPGSGILTGHFSPGAQISLRDAIRLMIVYSDNTATNMVIDRIGLPTTQEHMTALGLAQTRLYAKAYRRETTIDADRSEKYGLGSTTAREMLSLLEMLHAGQLADEAATKEMTAHLLACDEDQKLTRFLPAGTKVAHKGGAVSEVRNDAGILFTPGGPVAVCVLTANNHDQRWTDDNAANRLCAAIGLAVYNHFARRHADERESFPSTLARGSRGPMVESLQRTLNARLEPSPDLSVDGDFGMATERAVKRYQRRHDLEASGQVGPETWARLEPLIDEEPPAPPPEVVNSRVLGVAPPDPSEGPPFVTARAWAVGDGDTGKVLWGEAADEPLDCASTTKIMTGHLVCALAAHDATVLDEAVVISTRADETEGSNTGMRAGEAASVRELVYGLMLPSGNDAAVALAEHLGGRVRRPFQSAGATRLDQSPQGPYEAFVEAMNHEAQELCLKNTGFKNPHGITAEGHVTTCRDLITLSHAAMKDALFRQVVATRERGVSVTGASGYRRHLLWTNTNRLLRIDGNLGIKTGTTDVAGACLVSAARRGERTLLVCVLGASSGDARYTDSRNLYRWAWKKLDE